MAEELVEQFDPVSLEELEERAKLLRRVDNKYAVDRDRFVRLLERLRDDHQVLEIEGRREFAYCSTYFDTPDLRCYVDHIEDREPRFKARTRLYVDSERCVFEVKLKRGDGEPTNGRPTIRPTSRIASRTRRGNASPRRWRTPGSMRRRTWARRWSPASSG